MNDVIEIRDIRQQRLLTLGRAELSAAMPWADLKGEGFGPCALTFTPSGRLLFIGVRSASGKAGEQDAILRFNLNTRSLDVFYRLTFSPQEAALAHYNGQLYAGTAAGLYRFSATKNERISCAPAEVLHLPGETALTGLAIDIPNQRLYFSTESTLYRSPLTGLSLDAPVASLSRIADLTFARTYGGAGQGGLFLLQDSGALSTVPIGELRAGGTVNPILYTTLTPAPTGIAGTACGRILVAAPSPLILADDSDSRPDFETFLQSQFNGYVDVFKSSLLGMNGRTPPGFANGTGMKVLPSDPNDTVRQAQIGWCMLPLVAAGLVNNDPEIPAYIALAAQRTLGFHPDKLGGIMTIDGFMRDSYKSGTGAETNDEGGLALVHMKFAPALLMAADIYPHEADLQRYKNAMLERFKRHGDYMGANRRIAKGGTNYGPNRGFHIYSGENLPHAELTAAQDPLSSTNFEAYGYDRENYDYDEFLVGEPVTGNQPAYQVLSRTLLSDHMSKDPAWLEAGRNYYFSSLSIGDDLPSPYATAFSAGHHPSETGVWYSSNTLSRHKGNVIHFPALLGFGQFGVTSPAVGAYLAFRDGVARPVGTDPQIGTAPEMLLRYSIDYPTWIEPRTGPADAWFGAIGLANLIHPGILEKMRTAWYVPNGPLVSDVDGRVQLDFSRLSPRRVYARDDDTAWIPFGYQYSPFRLPPGMSFAHYKVEDHQGEIVLLPNADFAQGLLGWTAWTSSGAEPYTAAISDLQAIVGPGLQLTADSPAATSGLRQTIALGSDIEQTRFRLRGVVCTGDLPVGAEAYLLVEWDEDFDPDNGIVAAEQSPPTTNIQAWEELTTVITKPANADYAHLSIVFASPTSEGATCTFDELSLIRLGADHTGPNGNFETGDLSGWSASSEAISVINQSPLEGTYACRFQIPPGDTSEHVLSRRIDVSGDLGGWRYLYHLDVDVVNMADATFRLDLERYDAAGNLLDIKDWISSILPSTDGSILFTSRRAEPRGEAAEPSPPGEVDPDDPDDLIISGDPGDDHYVLKLTMQRGSAQSETATVVIDNFRRDKVRLFGEGDDRPPTPSTTEWNQAPAPSSPTSISMVAIPGHDPAGIVEYLFRETSGNPGGSDSAWQISPLYTDKELLPGYTYTYEVQMRERLGGYTNNPSAPASVRLPHVADDAPPSPATALWAQQPEPLDDTRIRMRATMATDAHGPVEYFFEETTGQPGASDSGWQSTPDYLDEDLLPNLTYCYRVRTRDALGNTGKASIERAATTPDLAPPDPTVAVWSAPPAALDHSTIAMTATVGSDPAGPVEYAFEEISGLPGGSSSGWQTDPHYIDAGLRAGLTYSYRVRMRDTAGNTTAYSAPSPATTAVEVTDLSPPNPRWSAWERLPRAQSDSRITMTAVTASDPSGPVEYLFEEMSGHPGSSGSEWQTSPTFVDDRLAPHTSYTYRVQTRDALGNTSAFSPLATATTLPASILTIDFGEPDQTVVRHAGIDVSAQVIESGSDEAPVYTITGLDVDRLGGADDTVTLAFAFVGTPEVSRVSRGYKLDPGSSLDLSVASATVTLGSSLPDPSLVSTHCFVRIEPQTVQPYEVSSPAVDYAERDRSGSTDLPRIPSLSITSQSPDTSNRIKYFSAEFHLLAGPPAPTHPTWATAPTPQSETAITMAASTATDPSGPVEYRFEELTGQAGGNDSDWQSSPLFTDTELQPGVVYRYRYATRDAAGNTGPYSPEALALTTDTSPPDPSPAAWAEVPHATGTTRVAMTATLATDPSGPVEYRFEELSNNPGSSSSAWQVLPTFAPDGLEPSTLYRYRVLVRDALGNTSVASPALEVATHHLPDTTPPSPSPASFAAPPKAVDESSITMTATSGSDASGSVAYYFEETSGLPGGSDSGWQTSPTYLDTGLMPSTTYAYRVSMRDNTGNVTTASEAEPITTMSDSQPPAPNPPTWALVPSANAEGNAITMTATPGIDLSGGVTYAFEEISGNPGGNGSGWQDSPTFIDEGLSPEQVYTYTFRMRDRVGNLTQFSAAKSASTADIEPPAPHPANWAEPPAASSHDAIAMRASTAIDRSGPVEYYFAELSGHPGGTDSGWQTDPAYVDDGLEAETTYLYSLRLRDAVGNVGDSSPSAEASTLPTPAAHTVLVDFSASDAAPTAPGIWNILETPAGTTILLADDGTNSPLTLDAWANFNDDIDGEDDAVFDGTPFAGAGSDGFALSDSTATGTFTISGFQRSDTVEISLVGLDNKSRRGDYLLGGIVTPGSDSYYNSRAAWNSGATILWKNLTGAEHYTLSVTADEEFPDDKPALSALRILLRNAPEGDQEAPIPNAATWERAPSVLDAQSLTMTATAGTDASGPVEYYFEETSEGLYGADSGWQTSPTYIATGLRPATHYAFRVRLRDAAGNTGEPSPSLSATTPPAPDQTPPDPDPLGWSSSPTATSATSIHMAALTATDPSGGVEYYFEELTHHPGANDSGWQTSPVYVDTGLDPATPYLYRVYVRDAHGNQGDRSASLGAITPAAPDSEGPPPFTVWIQTFGLSSGNTGLDMDPDADGLSNALEALYDGHPGQPDIHLTRLEASPSGALVFTYPSNPDRPRDLVVQYQWSLDFAHWYGSGEGPADGPIIDFAETTANGETTVSILPRGPSQIFFRLQVSTEAP